MAKTIRKFTAFILIYRSVSLVLCVPVAAVANTDSSTNPHTILQQLMKEMQRMTEYRERLQGNNLPKRERKSRGPVLRIPTTRNLDREDRFPDGPGCWTC